MIFDVFPRLRDTLTRGFLIEKKLLTQAPTRAPTGSGQVRGRAAKDGKGGGAKVVILGLTACSHGFGFEFRLGLGNGVELTD